MSTKSITPAWQDKALWVTLITMLGPLLAVLFHISVDPDKVAGLVVAYVVPAVTFVIAHKWKSAQVLLAEIESAAENAVELEPAAPIVTGIQVGDAAKALLLVLGIGLIAAPASAHAKGLDWSAGPSITFLEYDFGKAKPVQIAPGAGVQLSVTHDALKQQIGGKYWDLFSLAGMAFGSVVSPNGAQQFGVLSAAVGVCTMSSLICAGAGKHLLGPAAELEKGGWFWTLTLNFNVSLVPSIPASSDVKSWHLPRGNTLYVLGGP